MAMRTWVGGIVLVVLVAALGVTVATQQSRPAPAPVSSRFVTVTPPEGHSNFLWVVDTQTGAVAVHRFVSLQDENKNHITFIVEKLPTEAEYYELKRAPR